MLQYVLVACVVAQATSEHWYAPLESDPDFAEYVRFLRKYRSSEERRRMTSHSRERFEIFKANLRDIEERNARDTATYGVNMFSDLTDEEFTRQWTSGHHHWNESIAEMNAAGFTHVDPALQNATHRRRLVGGDLIVDWRFKDGGKVTRTKNQGGCGSCWAFAAISQMESDHAIANNQVVELSAQQVTSCTYEASRDGCNGGWPRDGINTAIKMGGLMLASDYPYAGRSTPCAFDPEKAVTRPVSIWTTKGSEPTMIERIAKSPITVAIDAGAYKSYRSGVMGCNAGGKNVNHAIQGVGYNSEENYWVVRNCAPPLTLLCSNRPSDPQSSVSCAQRGEHHGAWEATLIRQLAATRWELPKAGRLRARSSPSIPLRRHHHLHRQESLRPHPALRRDLPHQCIRMWCHALRSSFSTWTWRFGAVRTRCLT